MGRSHAPGLHGSPKVSINKHAQTPVVIHNPRRMSLAPKGPFREFSGWNDSASLRPASGVEQQPFQTAAEAKCRAIAGYEANIAFLPADGVSLHSCSPTASLLLKPSWIRHACPDCLLPGLRASECRIPCQPRMARCHLGPVLGDMAWPRESLPSGLSHHCDHQVSLASEETPSLSFQGTSADPGAGDTHAVALGTSSTISDSYRSYFIYLQLTMQPHCATSRMVLSQYPSDTWTKG